MRQQAELTAWLDAALPQLLPDFLPRQRWFGGKARPIASVAVEDAVWLDAVRPCALVVIAVRYRDGGQQRNAMLLACDTAETRLPLVGRVEGPSPALTVVEAGTDPDAILALLRGFAPAAVRALPMQRGGTLYYGDADDVAAGALDAGRDRPSVRPLGAEQSNTSLRLDRTLVFKRPNLARIAARALVAHRSPRRAEHAGVARAQPGAGAAPRAGLAGHARRDGRRAGGAPRFRKIRVHGDYHLGQTLKTDDGFVLIDFEGEPARPLAERRRKECALRDVAGMIRSFDYAVETAGAADGADAASVAPPVWRLRESFVAGYLLAAAARDNGVLPPDRVALDAWIDLFEVEKALYEVDYEINNRPAWVRIPLRGILRILGRHG